MRNRRSQDRDAGFRKGGKIIGQRQEIYFVSQCKLQDGVDTHVVNTPVHHVGKNGQKYQRMDPAAEKKPSAHGGRKDRGRDQGTDDQHGKQAASCGQDNHSLWTKAHGQGKKKQDRTEKIPGLQKTAIPDKQKEKKQQRDRFIDQQFKRFTMDSNSSSPEKRICKAYLKKMRPPPHSVHLPHSPDVQTFHRIHPVYTADGRKFSLILEAQQMLNLIKDLLKKLF